MASVFYLWICHCFQNLESPVENIAILCCVTFLVLLHNAANLYLLICLFLFPHETQGLFSWILVFIRVSDEHIRLKCGIDALQYIVFQKHLLVYTVIIFCLSIGIILPVNYSGTNGEKQSGGGGEGYSRFQVTGVIEGVFGFEIFNWGIFLGRKIWQVVFEVACFKQGFFWGIQNNLKMHGSACISVVRE